MPLEWWVSGVGVLVDLANRQASSIVPKRRGRCETTHRSCLLDVYATHDTREVAVQPRALECCGSWPRTGTRRRRLLDLAGGAWGGDRAVIAQPVRLMRNCEPVVASIPNGNSRCTCADQLASCGRTVLLLPLEWRVSGVGVLGGVANRPESSIVPKRRGRCETTHRSCLLDVYATRDTREVAVQPRALECCGS